MARESYQTLKRQKFENSNTTQSVYLKTLAQTNKIKQIMQEMQEKQEQKAKESLREFKSILEGKPLPKDIETEAECEKEDDVHSCCQEDEEMVME